MDEFEQHRSHLFGIAYRMLGSAMEAEDMIQETYLRYQAVDHSSIESTQAYLSTIITRLCLDQLKSARAQREMYIGEWLPEPVLTAENPVERVDDKLGSISMAFMVLLEKLSPVERAVFLLREVFDYSYAEIAEIVGKEEAACRQSLRRAKQHITENRPRFESTPEDNLRITERFMEAAREGSLDGLMALLADDVTLWSDGGGKVAASRHPIYGRDAVIRLLLGIRKQAPEGYTAEIREVNGLPGIIFRVRGVITLIANLDISEGKIQGLRMMVNPDKLARLQKAN